MILAVILGVVGYAVVQQPVPQSSVVSHSTLDWSPMFHHDLSHTGYSTSAGPLSNQSLWSYPTDNSVEYTSPAIVNGVVYVGSHDRNVYALNAITGSKIWSYMTGSSVESSPAVADGVVYVGSDDNKVYAFGSIVAPQPSPP